MKDLTMKTTYTTFVLTAVMSVMAYPTFAETAPEGMHRMPDGTLMSNHDMAAPVKAGETATITTSNKIIAKVNGLVCDFCVQAIQKTLLKEPGVTDAEVDLTAKTVTVGLKDGATVEEARLGKLLQDAGYDMVSYTKE